MAGCIPISWTVEQLDCIDGTVISTDTVVGNIDAVVNRDLVTILAERISTRDLAEWGGNLDGQLQERMSVSSAALRNASVLAEEIVASLDLLEAQWPGGAEIMLAESMKATGSFTKAKILSDLFVFLTESVAASNLLVDVPGGGLYVELNEAIAVIAKQDFFVIYHLLDAMSVSDAMRIEWLIARPAEGVSVLDAATAAYLRSLAESIDVNDEATIIFKLVEVVAVLDKLVSVKHADLTERVEVIGEVFSVIGELLAESLTVDATVLLARVNTLLESMAVSSGMVISFPKKMDESITITDGVLTAGTIYRMLLEESLTATVWLRAPSDLSVFCINPRLGGVTTYDGWDFNGYATDAAGDMWATNEEGVWRITEKPEEAVKSTVRFAKTSFGTESLKAIQQAYLALSTDGKVVLKYTNDEGTEAVYTIKPIPGLKTTRVKLAKGSIGRWFEFELSDEDATDLVIDEVSLVPLPLSRVMR